MNKQIRKLIIALKVLTAIFLVGVFGYMYLEKYTLLDSFYMTTITLSTVGFGVIRELSDVGKLFTIFLIFSGMTVVVYSFGVLASFLIEGEFKKYLKGVKMKKEISKLEGHFIICGYGNTGAKIIEKFIERKLEFVVIEREFEVINELKERYGDIMLFVHGDATKDEVLAQSGIKKAKTLISVLATDADNLFVTLSAKDLNSKLKVITKVMESGNSYKLRRAGADFTISTLDIAAERIFSTATEPNLVSFVDIVSKKSQLDGLRLEFIMINERSELHNTTLREARIPQKTNLVVIGVEKEDDFKLNPMSNTLLTSGSKLLVMGKEEQIEKLKKLAEKSLLERHIHID